VTFAIIFIIFGAFYITFEVFFNALILGFNKNKSLIGTSSIYMFLDGGLVGIFISLLYLIPIFQTLKFVWLFCLLGGVIITSIELLSGLFLNKVFKLKIWDYSSFKFNLFGQIELFHSIGWTLLSIIIFFIISGFRFFIPDNITVIDFIIQFLGSLK